MTTKLLSPLIFRNFHQIGSVTGLQTQSVTAAVAMNPIWSWQQSCNMAGHSKWQNIRHIKAAKDQQKQKTAKFIVEKIKVALREGGSSNPKLNSRLASLMAEGQAQNVPKTTLDNAIKNFEKIRNTGKVVFIEARGPCNTSLIVEGFTDRQKWLRQEVTHVLKKFGGSLGNLGSSSHSYNLKGIVNVALSDDKSVDIDEAEEVAIEAGAEDVEEAYTHDGKSVLQFICDQKDVHMVRKSLEKVDYKIEEARQSYLPVNTVQITTEQSELVTECLDLLDNIEDVVRVYDNVELKES